MKNNIKELSIRDLEKVHGGYIFSSYKGYEVINDESGHVITWFSTPEEAKEEAARLGMSTAWIWEKDLYYLRVRYEEKLMLEEMRRREGVS